MKLLPTNRSNIFFRIHILNSLQKANFVVSFGTKLRSKYLMICYFWLVLSVFFTAGSAWAVNFESLKQRLIADGLSPTYVEEIFSRPEVKFLPQIMPRKLLHDEYKLNYAQFLEPERVARAQKFLKANYELLSSLEKHFGVPKEVIVAIFLVETDLGRYTGKYETFNVLASMAIASDWEEVKSFLPENLSPEEEKRLKAFMKRRSKWAYKELVALLRYSSNHNVDPLSIKGSVFGAFGLPQFVPSSLLFYGYDWNKDGKIDLFNLEDALASIANYLARHGWGKAKDYQAQLKVIMTYNKSRPYAETVLSLAKKLKDASG
ncbi:membrane-bound lytic murein transglycosylase B [Thermodesulfatator indicus DSM 15286]|uniref:Membrane-bound lytic murein transglycosylase B n=1 Tax=Thermodesulfatator indicus (strain DSM 15286 / JCM 11887 / CIR29812) TaxID=667014 RepID=F8AB72_THEID|nr:lytic murein transglycosylase [Thermodesulfatator indicus]AEH45528.1 membrane-bound lytic murein transglycosylase B [Thermodesulfatator indicus DSM 15286]